MLRCAGKGQALIRPDRGYCGRRISLLLASEMELLSYRNANPRAQREDVIISQIGCTRLGLVLRRATRDNSDYSE